MESQELISADQHKLSSTIHPALISPLLHTFELRRQQWDVDVGPFHRVHQHTKSLNEGEGDSERAYRGKRGENKRRMKRQEDICEHENDFQIHFLLDFFPLFRILRAFSLFSSCGTGNYNDQDKNGQDRTEGRKRSRRSRSEEKGRSRRTSMQGVRISMLEESTSTDASDNSAAKIEMIWRGSNRRKSRWKLTSAR